MLKAWHDATIHTTDPQTELSVTMAFHGKQIASPLDLKLILCTKARRFMRTAYWITLATTRRSQIFHSLLTVRQSDLSHIALMDLPLFYTIHSCIQMIRLPTVITYL
jgi:hypothetical protein